jgi:hypothetical protein
MGQNLMKMTKNPNIYFKCKIYWYFEKSKHFQM